MHNAQIFGLNVSTLVLCFQKNLQLSLESPPELQWICPHALLKHIRSHFNQSQCKFETKSSYWSLAFLRLCLLFVLTAPS